MAKAVEKPPKAVETRPEPGGPPVLSTDARLDAAARNGHAANGAPRAPRIPTADLKVTGADARQRAGSDHENRVDRVPELDADLLLSDVKLALLLVNEARYRALDRLFGVPRDQANLATLIALGALAHALHGKRERLLKGPGGPTRADALLGAATLRELLHQTAGQSSEKTPLIETLVAIAVLAHLARPVIRRSSRRVRAISHKTRLTFNRRYGRPISAPRPARRYSVQPTSANGGQPVLPRLSSCNGDSRGAAPAEHPVATARMASPG